MLIFVFMQSSLSAQQTIYIAPSADVLSKGEVYIEFDASFKPNNQEVLSRFSSFGPRVIFGTGKNVEIGFNLLGNVQPGDDMTTISPNVKWKFYENKKKDFALFGGNTFYIPVRKRAYKFGSHTYLSMAKTIKDTRLTAGVFAASKNVLAPNASRGGAQFAVEQTLNSKITVAAEWISGKHSNGYFTPVLFYKPHPKVVMTFAYPLGNTQLKEGNHYAGFALGYSF